MGLSILLVIVGGIGLLGAIVGFIIKKKAVWLPALILLALAVAGIAALSFTIGFNLMG